MQLPSTLSCFDFAHDHQLASLHHSVHMCITALVIMCPSLQESLSHTRCRHPYSLHCTGFECNSIVKRAVHWYPQSYVSLENVYVTRCCCIVSCAVLAAHWLVKLVHYFKLIKIALKPLSSAGFLQIRRRAAVAHVTERHAASTAYVWVQTCMRQPEAFRCSTF
jgi:hypothetical protein